MENRFKEPARDLKSVADLFQNVPVFAAEKSSRGHILCCSGSIAVVASQVGPNHVLRLDHA